uniref:Pentatricopeptide repeat-containing protein At1g62930ic-like n=1 Tax=Rhizophora mucronata TaxID=61149 RepID=A0A2P2MV79_RHIMU
MNGSGYVVNCDFGGCYGLLAVVKFGSFELVYLLSIMVSDLILLFCIDLHFFFALLAFTSTFFCTCALFFEVSIDSHKYCGLGFHMHHYFPFSRLEYVRLHIFDKTLTII